MKELIVNFVSYGLAVSLERLMSFLLIPLYADAFSVTEFGIIDLIQTFSGIVIIFCFLQLETALQRYYYEYNGEEKGKFIFSVFFMILSVAVVLGTLVIWLSPYISLWMCGTGLYATVFKISAVQIVFSVLSTLTLILLRFEKKNKLFTVVVVGKSLLLVGAMYSFISIAHCGINGFFMSQLLAISMSALFALFLVRKLFVCHLSKSLMKLSLRYALPQFPARVGSATNAYANRFFILGYLDTYSVGLFSMALKIGSIMQLVQQTFMMAWNQYMFETLKKPNNQQQFIFVFRILVPVVFFISICLFLFAEELIVNFASPKFVESARYVGCITIAISLLIVKEVVDIGPKYKSKTYYLSISFLAALGVNLVSLFFFIRCFGLEGVVYSMVIANSTLLVLSWFFSHKLYPINFPRKIMIASVMPALLLAILMVYVTIPLSYRFILLLCVTVYYFLLVYRVVFRRKKNVCHI